MGKGFISLYRRPPIRLLWCLGLSCLKSQHSLVLLRFKQQTGLQRRKGKHLNNMLLLPLLPLSASSISTFPSLWLLLSLPIWKSNLLTHAQAEANTRLDTVSVSCASCLSWDKVKLILKTAIAVIVSGKKSINCSAKLIALVCACYLKVDNYGKNNHDN